jgi:hypothetical protein
MNCEKTREYISLRVDGRLDAYGERLLEEHLASCPSCRKALAALESAEKAAKTSRAKEPRAGYWDTFSGRVMGRIESEEAQRNQAWWKRWVPVTLPPTGKRMRFAAGVASIAVAVVAGVLFVARLGDRAVPTAILAPVEREVPQELETPADKGKDMLAENEASPPAVAKTQAARTSEAKHEAPVTEKKEVASAGAEKDAMPPRATQGSPEAAPPQVAEAVKEETRQEKTRATLENEAVDAASPADAEKGEKLAAPAPERIAQPSAFSLETADKRGSVATLHSPGPAGGAGLRKISDSDTTLTVDGLRAHIAAWQARIDSAPADSLREEGYREVAAAFSLLAQRTQAEADIDEGARVVETYLAASKDPATREFLAAELKEIQALRRE